MMKSYLLALSGENAKLLLAYGGCAAIILGALIVMAFLKRNTKRQMRPVSVKKACEKAKAYAEDSLSKNKGAKTLLGATKLHYISGLVAHAAWLAYQIVENKKDIIFDSIANGLDALATSLAKESEQGYLPEEEYEASVKAAIEKLDATIEKLDKMMGA